MTPWTVACQVSLSMGFPRQEYWSGLPFPSPQGLPDTEIEALSPALQVDTLLLSYLGSPNTWEVWFIGGQCSIWLPHKAKRFGKLRGFNFQLEQRSCTQTKRHIRLNPEKQQAATLPAQQCVSRWETGLCPIASSSCHQFLHPRSHIDDLKTRNACLFQQPVKTGWTTTKFNVCKDIPQPFKIIKKGGSGYMYMYG